METTPHYRARIEFTPILSLITMDHRTLSATVEAIRQAFGYVERFKDKLFVIKIADSLIHHRLSPLLLRDLVLLHRLGIRIAIVPGARPRIDEVLQAFGIQWDNHAGIRVSPARAMPYIEMAASDVANHIMTLLAEHNANAVVGNWVRARSIGVRDGIDYESSGVVDSIQHTLVRKALEDGLIPIFPNIGWGPRGRPYNISSNQLALTVSQELEAAKLFFVTDFDPIQADAFRVPDGTDTGEDGVVSVMTLEQARQFVVLNASENFRPELEMVSLALDACQGGVPRVHVVDGRIEGALLKEIFSNRGIGTMVCANQHVNVRPAVRSDIPDMTRLMQPSVNEGKLVARTADDLEGTIDDFVVYEVDETLHGCGALHLLSARHAEIAGIAVDEAYGSKGIGRAIVSSLLDRAHRLKLTKAFVLTTQTADWFLQLGFHDGSLDELPKGRRMRYDPRRRSRVLVYDLRARRIEPRLQVE